MNYCTNLLVATGAKLKLINMATEPKTVPAKRIMVSARNMLPNGVIIGCLLNQNFYLKSN